MMNVMAKTVFTCLLFFLLHTLTAQVPEPDKSPMDISYAPSGYPIQKFQGKQKNNLPLARVIYSRPQVNGRTLFGNEIRYNEIWRLGANESTELELFRSAIIGGKTIPKGRYTLFCIPNADKWTIIINKDNFSWGAFSYKQGNDVVRVIIPVERVSGQRAEFFTIYFNEKNHLVIMWDSMRATVPVDFNSAK
jgi:hypothetical protein